jgi:hypothetical protein
LAVHYYEFAAFVIGLSIITMYVDEGAGSSSNIDDGLLETLQLTHLNLDITAAQVLGSASRLTRLKKLALAFNEIGSQGVWALLNGGAAWLATFEDLDLSETFWSLRCAAKGWRRRRRHRC